LVYSEWKMLSMTVATESAYGMWECVPYKERRRSRFPVANTLQATFSDSSVRRVRI
jgi:hypothetical protein